MRKYIEHIAGKMPDKDWQLYKQHLKAVKSKKGEVILGLQKPCKTIWHMTKGAVRKFEMDNGIEKTTHFYVAPKVFTVLHSVLTGGPSDLSIICEEDCEFLTLDIDQLADLYQQSIYIERVGRRMAEEEFIEEFSMRRMFLKLDALQRYEYMEQKHPEVLMRFQLKDVATFLGVTPETLSRLRKMRFSA
ncbi:cyclic nucleotide-binding domain-containing protein [Phaeodactylibacter sp.]|uniref:Crp/Fnr family transcriptional regulator n=1 Tax=Phaeodactylibacter sp. TaxID=1940289 RepID=UPI0025D8B3BD|nr:cyclic nucleotide-binding domain-containing protein [Phaeodactylibacter sp.]MCI5058486.1 cyclic nucleotide-binding domain-containing protein [Flavobacteriales bacterium]MCI5090914.1 cyclic nucleotide-binding domain-containing protein [Phaeodactylibacter sp.]